jgi:hypothetical protein
MFINFNKVLISKAVGENTNGGDKGNKCGYGMLCLPVLHKRDVSIAVKLFNNIEH